MSTNIFINTPVTKVEVRDEVYVRIITPQANVYFDLEEFMHIKNKVIEGYETYLRHMPPKEKD